ncbi:MAG TPA: YiiX family permuted papain-like enzyme [Bacteroidia bacterium]
MKKTLLLITVLIAASLTWLSFDDGSKKKFGKTSTDYSWLKEGDVVFQDFEGDFGEAIKLATKSNYSHCGMIMTEGNKIMVYEAVGPVKYTPIAEWVKHGAKRSFVAKRLKDKSKIGTEVQKLWHEKADAYSGIAYDHVFGWTDEKMYCSELVWKMYKKGMNIELSVPKKLKDFDLSHPLVRQQLEMRYGNNVPYEENVVSPQDLFESALLEEIKK